MKKTDRSKYLAIFISFLCLAISFAGYRQIAAFIMVPAIFMLSSSPSKSGNLIFISMLITMGTAGFLTDYPLKTFPPTLVFLMIVTFTMQFRSLFFDRMYLYKILPLEAIMINICFVGFIVTSIIVHYTWQQWVSGGLPVLLFALFSVIIYKDRDQARQLVKDANIVKGNVAPDFTLNDQNGNPVSLRDLLKTQHVLLIFVRGDWCPTCHMMMRGYVKNKEVFAQKNVRIIGVGPDPVGVNKEIMSRIDENSLLLSDDDQQTAFLYTNAIQENNPVTKKLYTKGIPLPASFLVHQNGKIIFTSRSDKAAEILQPEKIFEALVTI